MLIALFAIIKKDLLLAVRRREEFFNPIIFYVIVISLFPLGVSPDRSFLNSIAPGVVWVTALLAALISMNSMFRSDFDDGSIEHLILSPHPTAFLMLGKVIAHWLITGLPMLIVVPFMASMLHISNQALSTLIFTLLLGTPLLSLIGAIGVALTAGLRGNGVLLGLLVLPFYVPILIFATSAVSAASQGLPTSGQIAIMGAGLIIGLLFSPFAIAAALKISVS